MDKNEKVRRANWRRTKDVAKKGKGSMSARMWPQATSALILVRHLIGHSASFFRAGNFDAGRLPNIVPNQDPPRVFWLGWLSLEAREVFNGSLDGSSKIALALIL